jgi:serine/threonine-protein kinase
VLVAGELNPSSITPDGRQVVASRGAADIVIVTLESGQARVRPLFETTQRATSPALSRDGRWLAYSSNVSGRDEVYVRPYPGPGAPEPVSVEGGRGPAWNPNGRELFFLSPYDPAGGGQTWMMAVDFAPGPPSPFGSAHGGLSAVEGPRIGRPRVVFEYDRHDIQFDCIPTRCYDIAPDGQRFYVMQARTPPPPPVVTHINLIPNWLDELKAKVPTGGRAK